MKTIVSAHNPLIKQVASLATNKGRSTYNQFLAEGKRIFATIIAAGLKPIHLFITAQHEYDASLMHYNPTLVSDVVMKKISQASTPSGVLGVFTIPEKPKPETIESGLVLAEISEPGNMGTLIRTAVALGKKNIVIIDGTDPWSPKVIQSSAGTIALAKIYQWSWQELVRYKGSLPLCALVVEGGQKPEVLDLKKSFLVVGNEAHGIRKDWLADCTLKMTLPMPGGAESLNAAIAGSIAIYLTI